MPIRFHELPLEVFPEPARPFVRRLNHELRQLSALEGNIRNPLLSKRSDKSIVRRQEEQVHVTRIIPGIGPVLAGVSSVIGTPELILGTVNTIGTTNTVLAVDSEVALFDTTSPAGISTGAAVGAAAIAARRDHVHEELEHNRVLSVDKTLAAKEYVVAAGEYEIADGVELELADDSELMVL